MFYLLNKPKGITSFKAIKDFAKMRHISKIGHTGTLDPLASGLLLVATDEDTKLIEYIDKGSKTYVATMQLGKTSDTYDIEGDVESSSDEIPSETEVKLALNSFSGTYLQTPPAFSAKKIKGKKAYDLAREGKTVILEPVKVTISDIKDFVYKGDNIYSFEVTVSRGTYIRSLIHDLGQKLGCGAIMTDLVRNKIGSYVLQEDVQEIKIVELISLPLIKISKMQDLIHGKEVRVNWVDGIFAIEFKNDIFGVVEVQDGIAKPTKLLGKKFAKAGF